MELIARAPWHEAVTYRDTWPHEYVVVEKDGQQELLAAFRHRISQGEGIECRFFHRTQEYLFLGEYKYWAMQGDDDIILNRALLYKDGRDFVIREGDTGVRGIIADDNTDADQDESIATTSGSEGRIQQLDIREIWADEAADFTPWLAQNLNLLGKELGLNLELVEQEKEIGWFYLDILARDVDGGTLVAIENQLEWSDHSHLGQLLTYVSGCDAESAVWISPWIRPEHRQAINRLNQLSDGKIQFYGVEIRAIKVGDSPPAPDFRPVAVPDSWEWWE